MDGKYAMYLRKSREDVELEKFGELETLSKHERILDEFCKTNGYTIVKKYKEVVSGESLQAREEMQKLLDDVKRKMYDGVVVIEIERLTRGNTLDQGLIYQAFSVTNTKIITPSKVYDTNNDMDETQFEFGMLWSRHEYKTIISRYTRGKKQAVVEGNWMCSTTPFGYDAVRRKKHDRILVPNNDAEVVKMIFDWYTEEGLGSGGIVARLKQLGIKTQKGNDYWNKTTIMGIIKNKVYIGKNVWYKRRVKKEYDDNLEVVKKVKSTPEEMIEVDGKWEGIISEEQFNKAQEIRKASLKVTNGRKLMNPFAGVVFCKECGKAINYCIKPNGDRYGHKHGKGCKTSSILKEDFMSIIIEVLKKSLDDCDYSIGNDCFDEQIKRKNILISNLENSLQNAKNKRLKIFDYFESGIYSEEDFIDRKKKVDDEIKSIEKSLKFEKSSVPVKIDYQQRKINLHKLIDTLQDDSIEAKEKNIFIKTFIDRIEYSCIKKAYKDYDITIDIFYK